MRQRILRLARTTYAGFNDHHLTEKLREVEGIRMGRETLRQLLRAAGIGPPRKRRPPARIASGVRAARGKARCCKSMAVRILRPPRMTAAP